MTSKSEHSDQFNIEEVARKFVLRVEAVKFVKARFDKYNGLFANFTVFINGEFNKTLINRDFASFVYTSSLNNGREDMKTFGDKYNQTDEYILQVIADKAREFGKNDRARAEDEGWDLEIFLKTSMEGYVDGFYDEATSGQHHFTGDIKELIIKYIENYRDSFGNTS